MQYSPYSATMNPYQTIYNNGGAAAYQPTWGYTDAIGHLLNTNAVLPLGYTRQQYNEERALAAESMWKSPLMGLGAFGIGTLGSYAIFGSPFQDLAAKVGGPTGAFAYNVGFSGVPNNATIFRAARSVDNATDALRQGVSQFRAGEISRDELQGLFASRRAARNMLADTKNAAAFRTTLWGTLGNISKQWSDIKSDTAFVTGKVFGGIGTGIGKAFEVGTGSVGGLLESQINTLTGNVASPWLQKTGASLFEATESGWMATALDRADRIAKLENRAAKLFKSAETAASTTEAGRLIKGAEVLTRRAEVLREGLFGRTKRGIASAAKNIGTILKSGGGISGLISAGGGAVLSAGLGFAGNFAAAMFNPVTMAEFYMLGQAVEYGVDAYQNYQVENEIKRNLMVKGNRILQYGFAEGARGLQAGFSVSQQDRLVSRLRDMASIGANKGDLFGFGADSLFGGHQRYSERLRELKSILNVGTDMGFFDMSRSMDDFEKKFEQTVKTVDKLSKLLKRTKGEIMTVMANVQNTEGLYNMNDIGASVRKKDFAARISGVDLTTAMQESAAGAQMSRQVGFSASLGASIMSDNRVMMNRAIRSGDITREELFRFGGEQGVLTNMQQGMLALLHDESFRQELAMNYELDAKTGRYVFKGNRLNRLAGASAEELRKMHDERYLFANGVSYSRRKYANVRGGKYYDITRDMQADLASGKISQEQMNSIVSGLILQRHAILNPSSTLLQREEALAQGLQEMGIDYEIARVMAKNQMGGYNQFRAHDEMMVAVDRYRDAYDKSGMNFSMLMDTGFAFTKSSWGRGFSLTGGAIGAGVGGWIGAHFGHGMGGGLVGAGVGSYLGRAAAASTAIVLNNLAPTSNLATSMRNDLKASFIAQGINPNFVDSYLLGPSAEETVAGIKPGQLAERLAFLVEKGVGASGTAANTGSGYWKTLAAGFDAIGNEINSNRAKGYARAFLASNNAAGYDVRNTLEGVLNVFAGSTESELKEYGIKKEDAVILSQISSAIRRGDKIDLTSMSQEQIGRIGEMLGVAFSVAGSDKLYENKQKLMGILQIDENGTTEAELRNRIFGSKSSLRYIQDSTKKVGWLSTIGDQMLSGGSWNMFAPVAMWNLASGSAKGIYKKWQGVTNQAEANYLSGNANTSWQSIMNRAKYRNGILESAFGWVSDRIDYYFREDSAALNRVKNIADNMDFADISLIEKAMANPEAFSPLLKQKLNKFSDYYKDSDAVYGAIRELANTGRISNSNRGILNNELYGIYSHLHLKAVSEVAGKAMESDNIKNREYVVTAAKLLTSDRANASAEITKMGATAFVKKLLTDKSGGLTDEQKTAFLGKWQQKEFLESFGKFNEEDQVRSILKNMLPVIELASKSTIKQGYEEKAMSAEGEKNATVLTDQAMKDFKEGSLIIREVAGRLGFY